jgi:hypothetical protein
MNPERPDALSLLLSKKWAEQDEKARAKEVKRINAINKEITTLAAALRKAATRLQALGSPVKRLTFRDLFNGQTRLRVAYWRDRR